MSKALRNPQAWVHPILAPYWHANPEFLVIKESPAKSNSVEVLRNLGYFKSSKTPK